MGRGLKCAFRWLGVGVGNGARFGPPIGHRTGARSTVTQHTALRAGSPCYQQGAGREYSFLVCSARRADRRKKRFFFFFLRAWIGCPRRASEARKQAQRARKEAEEEKNEEEKQEEEKKEKKKGKKKKKRTEKSQKRLKLFLFSVLVFSGAGPGGPRAHRWLLLAPLGGPWALRRGSRGGRRGRKRRRREERRGKRRERREREREEELRG